MCAAFRSYFASLPMKDVSINIWIDASLQKRSRELLASSFHLVITQGDGAPKVERRLFPMLRIGLDLRTAIGKFAALANLVAGGTRLCAHAYFPAERRVNHGKPKYREFAGGLA